MWVDEPYQMWVTINTDPNEGKEKNLWNMSFNSTLMWLIVWENFCAFALFTWMQDEIFFPP
jgi:hypothetical protein